MMTSPLDFKPQGNTLFGKPTTTYAFGSVIKPARLNLFEFTASANPGTSIAKYQPTIGSDTLMKGGQANTVNTKQHCITAMKEYEGKSVEELRMEDYFANRKSPHTGDAGSTTQTGNDDGLFGAILQQPSKMEIVAGTTDNKNLFRSTTNGFGQPITTGFEANATQPLGASGSTGFGATVTAASTSFGAKPAFSQTAAPLLFGETAAISSAPAFEQTTKEFCSDLATTAQPATGIFGSTSQTSASDLGSTKKEGLVDLISNVSGQIGTTGTRTNYSGTTPVDISNLIGNKFAFGETVAPLTLGQTSSTFERTTRFGIAAGQHRNVSNVNTEFGANTSGLSRAMRAKMFGIMLPCTVCLFIILILFFILFALHLFLPLFL